MIGNRLLVLQELIFKGTEKADDIIFRSEGNGDKSCTLEIQCMKRMSLESNMCSRSRHEEKMEIDNVQSE